MIFRPVYPCKWDKVNRFAGARKWLWHIQTLEPIHKRKNIILHCHYFGDKYTNIFSINIQSSCFWTFEIRIVITLTKYFKKNICIIVRKILCCVIHHRCTIKTPGKHKYFLKDANYLVLRPVHIFNIKSALLVNWACYTYWYGAFIGSPFPCWSFY